MWCQEPTHSSMSGSASKRMESFIYDARGEKVFEVSVVGELVFFGAALQRREMGRSIVL